MRCESDRCPGLPTRSAKSAADPFDTGLIAGVPRFSTSVVTALISEREGLQRVALDSGRRAYVLTGLIGRVDVGDTVVVNTTAVDLDLGTGGWDVVHWNLAREAFDAPGPGHVMKMRYTSLQADTGVAEEADSYTPGSLDGVPVVVCSVHSQLAAVAAAFAAGAPGRRLAYAMTDSAALPLRLSDLVASLRAAGLIALTVSAGQAFGGDLEAVNALSALEVATGAGADALVVGPGPGGVGTGTERGHGAVDAAVLIDLAGRAGALPVVAVRYSDADRRARHRGVSHHTATALRLAHEAARVAVPAGEPPPDLAGTPHVAVEVDASDPVTLLDSVGIAVRSMGRSVAEDPGFHRWAAAAGTLAASVASGR